MNLRGQPSYLHNWAGSCQVLRKIKIYSPNRMALIVKARIPFNSVILTIIPCNTLTFI